MQSIIKLIRSHLIGQIFKLNGKPVAWKKVTELKPGMKIAVPLSVFARPPGLRPCEVGQGSQLSDSGQSVVSQSVSETDRLKTGKLKSENRQQKTDNHLTIEQFNHSDVDWDEIVSVTKVSRERVWDIEVEATHNFVAGHYVNSRTGRALTEEQEELYLAWKNQKIPQSGTLVNLTDSLNDWTDNLDDNISAQSGLVNRGVDLPGIGPGRFGLSDQSSKPAKPTPVTLSQLEAAGVNEKDLPFIAYGGIVAHNTTGILMRAGQSTLQLSSGTTSTTADIQLAAADRIDLSAAALSISTSGTADGSLKLTAKSNLTLDTSQNNANILLLPGTGNVGIGTTGPTAKLHVYNAANVDPSLVAGTYQPFTLYSGGADISMGNAATSPNYSYIQARTAGVAWPLTINPLGGGVAIGYSTPGTAALAINGNVGIGTTGPGAKLEIIGTGTYGSAIRINGVSSQAPNLQLYNSGSADAGSRNWAIVTTDLAYGDFNIKQSNAKDGDPTSAGTSRLYIGATGNVWLSGTAANTSPTMAIQQSGNVGIGTTDPSD